MGYHVEVVVDLSGAIFPAHTEQNDEEVFLLGMISRSSEFCSNSPVELSPKVFINESFPSLRIPAIVRGLLNSLLVLRKPLCTLFN